VPKYCLLPTAKTVTGRSSSITNAFIVAVVPVIEPTEAEELEALGILGMTPTSIRCAYCGDAHTEWDHLRPVVRGKEPTGYITEIANLVPACGKCNQSKGASYWKDWIQGPAKLSPKTRAVAGLEERIERLVAYEAWKVPKCIDFAAEVGDELWQRHRKNWNAVLDLLRESQDLAKEIRQIVTAKHAS
jgi:hypothetical protein